MPIELVSVLILSFGLGSLFHLILFLKFSHIAHMAFFNYIMALFNFSSIFEYEIDWPSSIKIQRWHFVRTNISNDSFSSGMDYLLYFF